MNAIMRNKYTWILVNLLLSLSLVIFVWIIDDSDPLKEDGINNDNALWVLLLWVVFYGGPVLWLYKTIVWWRNCIRLEDPVFQEATNNRKEEIGNE